MKGREFWIDIDRDFTHFSAEDADNYERNGSGRMIHVIEYSAYRDKSELAEAYYGDMTIAEEKLAIAVEALETLEVAVNDKINDPGATNFIRKALAKIKDEK